MTSAGAAVSTGSHRDCHRAVTTFGWPYDIMEAEKDRPPEETGGGVLHDVAVSPPNGKETTMKWYRKLFYGLMFLPLALALVSLPFLPEQIPAHYDSAGLVTRWGSRFEVLILPPCVVLFGFFLRFMAKLTGELSGKQWEKISLLIGCAGLLVLNGVMIFILYTSFCQVEDISRLFSRS